MTELSFPRITHVQTESGEVLPVRKAKLDPRRYCPYCGKGYLTHGGKCATGIFARKARSEDQPS